MSILPRTWPCPHCGSDPLRRTSTPTPSLAALAELDAVVRDISAIIAKFPGWEPESLKLQPAMVPVGTLHDWLATLRKIREGIA